MMQQRSETVIDSRSIDKVRLIRGAMRCFTFGALGLMPVLGAGLAVQALRLADRINAELGQPRNRPAVYFYWTPGLLLLWLGDTVLGLAGEVVACVALLTLQSIHVWRSARRMPAPAGNPAYLQVTLGVTLAYAGLALSLWLLAAVGHRIVQLNATS
jgi:hypothetical protein